MPSDAALDLHGVRQLVLKLIEWSVDEPRLERRKPCGVPKFGSQSEKLQIYRRNRVFAPHRPPSRSPNKKLRSARGKTGVREFLSDCHRETTARSDSFSELIECSTAVGS